MRLILLATAMLICACGGALLAWMTSHKRTVARQSYHAQLADMLVKQSRADLEPYQKVRTKEE